MENFSQNILYLSGRIASPIEYSHDSHGAEFYTFKLKSQRLSGAFDTVNVLINKTQLAQSGISTDDFISARCELRSFNKKTDSGSRLIISAFVKELEPCTSDTYENSLHLTGTICKPPVYRKTPLGREICDIMLAINRKYGRSDYIPLITWGRNARIAETFCVGDVITVFGRLQSREYIKMINGEETVRTAYEVSVSSIEATKLEDSSSE